MNPTAIPYENTIPRRSASSVGDWPHVSVYQNDVEKDGKYFRNDCALFRIPYDWRAANDWNLYERIASAPFSMGTLWETREIYNGKLLFEFQIALVDENGKILAKNTSSERHDDSWNNGSGYYDVFVFDGVTQASMKIIGQKSSFYKSGGWCSRNLVVERSRNQQI